MIEWAPFPADVRLSGDDLDDYMGKYGVPTTVRRSIPCGCLNRETRRPTPGHELCGGWGWRYPADLEIEALRVQWVGQSLSRKAQEAGVIEPGDFTVTWPSSQALGIGDLFVHPNEEAVTDDVLIRGAIDPEGNSLERLRFHYPTALEDVRDNVRTYVAGVDFDLAADGRTFVWRVAGNRPDAGAVFTCRYRYRAEYIIARQIPKARHDGSSANRLTFTCRVDRYDPVAQQQGANLGEGTG